MSPLDDLERNIYVTLEGHFYIEAMRPQIIRLDQERDALRKEMVAARNKYSQSGGEVPATGLADFKRRAADWAQRKAALEAQMNEEKLRLLSKMKIV
jgi:hypothetical protein